MPQSATTTSRDSLITCVIAGGAGFIGSWVCEKLLDQNCYVYCVDTFSAQRQKTIASLATQSNFELIETPLAELTPDSFDRDIDYIFHLAGVEAFVNGVEGDLDMLLVNAFGTKNLLTLAQRTKAKFLLGSSEDLYHQFAPGDTFSTYFGSTTNVQNSNVFLEAKRFAESITVEFAKRHVIDARIVRLAFLYGERMNPDGSSVLPQMLRYAVTHSQVAIPNDGMAVVYPTYITDAVFGVIKAMFSQSSRGKIYSLINTQPYTLLSIGTAIQSALNLEREPIFLQDHPVLPQQALSQMTIRSQEALGWYPRASFEPSLQKTLNWLHSNLSSSVQVNDQKPVQHHAQPTSHAQVFTRDEPQSALPKEGQTHNQDLSGHSLALAEQDTAISPQPLRPQHSLEQDADQQTRHYATAEATVVQLSVWQRLSGYAVMLLSPLSFLAQPRTLRVTAAVVGGLLLLLFIVLLPVGVYLWFHDQVASNIAAAITSFRDSDLQAYEQHTQLAQQRYQQAEQLAPVVAWQADINPLLQDSHLRQWQRQAPLVFAFANTGNEWLTTMHQLHLAIVGQLQADIPALFEVAESQLQSMNDNLAALLLTNPESVFGVSAQHLRQLQTRLEDTQTLIGLGPDILGVEGSRTLLLLIQDSSELRPTGGFLDAVAILSFDHGVLLTHDVYSVAELDAKQIGEIVPPKAIAQELGQSQWYLRDSNIHPDFIESSSRAAWFLQKQLGITVDGMVGVTTYGLMPWLDMAGPVELTGVDEPVTGQNLHVVLRSLATQQPDSTQDSGLAQLVAQMLDRYTQDSVSKTVGLLAPQLVTALHQRDLAMVIPGTEIQGQLNQLAWDGSLRSVPTQLRSFGELDVLDFVSFNEANMGINKVSPFIKRLLTIDISIDQEGVVRSTAELEITNTAKSQMWPLGVYQSYIQLILSDQTQLQSVAKLQPDQGQPKSLTRKDILLSEQTDKQIVGFHSEIAQNQTSTITVKFQSQDSVDFGSDNQGSYALYLQKQAGVPATPAKVALSFPPEWTARAISQEAMVEPGHIQFVDSLAQDRLFAISWSQ